MQQIEIAGLFYEGKKEVSFDEKNNLNDNTECPKIKVYEA